jgi:mannonate dehydratase
MFRMMKAYKQIGFDGPLRSDHVPTMAGETNDSCGYEMKGSLFGIGYIKGLLDALDEKEVGPVHTVNKDADNLLFTS